MPVTYYFGVHPHQRRMIGKLFLWVRLGWVGLLRYYSRWMGGSVGRWVGGWEGGRASLGPLATRQDSSFSRLRWLGLGLVGAARMSGWMGGLVVE